MNNYPVLLVGFNRPDKVFERTKEILCWNPSKLYISIDGGRSQIEEKFTAEIKELLSAFVLDPRVHLIFRSQNFGIKYHLPIAIDEILQSHNAVIVIEDDVQCSSNFYDEICRALRTYGTKYFTIGGFSPLSRNPFRRKNRWRETKYFSAWGWGITRESWMKYDRSISSRDFHTDLDSSAIWRKLSKSQKETWVGRFGKVSSAEKMTWDIQMQYSSFTHDQYHLNSLFRICENQGFSDVRGTNTKSKRPLILGKYFLDSSPFGKSPLSRFPVKVLEYLDSLMIAGDRKSFHRLVRNLKAISSSKNLRYR